MSLSRSATTEIIIAGYDDAPTASLVNAALARLREEFGLAINDVAVVMRGADGRIAVQQTLCRNADRSESSAFWEALADQLFVPESSFATATHAASGKGAAVGIDVTSASRIANQLGLCKSAVLVRTEGLKQQEKVVGVLQGFNGELVRVPFDF